MKIICVGHAVYDTTIPMCGFLEENTKLRIDTKFDCGGGPACNAAYLLGKWGADTTFIGLVGNDKYGKFIKKELEEVNVNTKYLKLQDGYETTSSIIFANVEEGTRTIVSYRPGEAVKLNSVDLDFKPDVILIDGHEYELSKELLIKYPDAISVMDAGRVNDYNIELAKMINYVVCSKDFAEELTEIKIKDDDSNLREVYMKLKSILPNNVIVTLENKGCLYEYKGKLKIMPGINVKTVDSTGAGDIFHGAFTYGIANGWNLEKILRFSNVTAGLSVTKVGGRNSIFDLEKINEVYEQIN